MIIGILAGVGGFLFMMFAHEKFKTIGTNVPTNQGATECVVQGAYQFSRNPMYVGGSMFFIGMGLIAGSVWMLISYLPLGFYLLFYVVPKEEAYMERSFGDKYQVYCQKVRRWI
jgi:protein-S-isoprenylcysteine O-methyltransferase Ste14